MPLLDSFTVDHTRMAAPAVRVAKTMKKYSATNRAVGGSNPPGCTI